MALRAAELEILFTADTTDVAKAEKTVKSAGERLEKKPIKTKVDADAKDALESMDRVEESAKRIVSAKTIATVDANIERAEKSFMRVYERLDYLKSVETELDVSADIRRAEANLSKVQRNLDGLRSARAVMEVDANTAPAEDALAGAKDIAGDAGEDAGEEFGANIVAALATIPIAGAIVGVGAAAASALIDAFNDGLAQEARYDRLQALTGISEADALRLGRAAGEAYASNFGESIESNMDTARLALQFDLIDADTSTRSAQRVVESLAGIADVLGEDVRPVAAAVTQLLRTGLAKSADEAFDIIAAGARNGVNVSEDMLDTFTEYPALFARLGLSGAEALGLINQGLDAGARNSDLAADALKEFQIRASDGTAAEGFQILGMNAEAAMQTIAEGGPGARDALEEVLTKLGGMEAGADRTRAAVALFGTQAEDLGEALFAMDLSTAVEQLNGVEGAARAMFDTLAGNDAAKVEQAKRNIEVAAEGIQGALASAFSEPLGDFADWVSENRGPLLQFFADLVNGAIDFGISVVESAASGTEAFGEFVSGPLATVVDGIGRAMAILNPQGGGEMIGIAEQMRGFKDETAEAAGAIRENLIPGLEGTRDKFNGFMDGAIAVGYLNDASVRLAGALGQVGVDAEGALLALDGINLANLSASDSGRQLEEQIRNAVIALQDEQVAASASGESQEELAERYRAGTEALVGQLTQMGLTKEQAQALIDTVLQTPTDAKTEYSSNADAEKGKVQSLADRITTLPDGTVVITADTQPAIRKVDGFIRDYSGRVVQLYVDASGRPINVGMQANGSVLEFMAQGGLRGLTPMQPIAQMVPANTWRVVGDRGDVAEAYIPLDGSARSMAILFEAMRRMGVVLPMADGGLTSGARAMPAPAFPPIALQLLREIRDRVGISLPIDPIQGALGASNVWDSTTGRA
ncbi:phage tail tape measure protein [Agromyces indicus]|uniref:Phage tail tape measure protein n=1 Tax=Agromyces indicus TaxID=758919 RepID=A0ABU1FKD0_9MICO|nr:phage tail tape measure protein [Agromyces indicus]MDR5691911.1 phage tail tape measure protein [Agromyces indicus]